MIVYLDTETTGLDPERHQIWEIAWAVGDGPIRQAFVPHTLENADRDALKIGRYLERWEDPETDGMIAAFADMEGATLCAANAAFDEGFLRARWLKDRALMIAIHGFPMAGRVPWRYRLLDIEAYAMGALGWGEPRGLRDIAAALQDRGWDVPAPDHTAAADVACLRVCHQALRQLYGAGIRQEAGR
jgi:hypothetical protein